MKTIKRRSKRNRSIRKRVKQQHGGNAFIEKFRVLTEMIEDLIRENMKEPLKSNSSPDSFSKNVLKMTDNADADKTLAFEFAFALDSVINNNEFTFRVPMPAFGIKQCTDELNNICTRRTKFLEIDHAPELDKFGNKLKEAVLEQYLYFFPDDTTIEKNGRKISVYETREYKMFYDGCLSKFRFNRGEVGIINGSLLPKKRRPHFIINYPFVTIRIANPSSYNPSGIRWWFKNQKEEEKQKIATEFWEIVEFRLPLNDNKTKKISLS